MTRLNVANARCEALFASWLQRSDDPTAERVAEAISRAVRRFGTRGCACWMAQEFGDHPEAAAERMRWVRQLTAGTTARHLILEGAQGGGELACATKSTAPCRDGAMRPSAEAGS